MENNFKSAGDLVFEKLESWQIDFIKVLPNLIVALIVVIIFSFLAKIARGLTSRLLRKRVRNNALVQLITSCTYIFVILLGVFVALGVLNLDKTVTSLLAGAGVIGLALGFAFQEMAANFFSGVFIALKKPYNIGDILEVDSYWGEVESIKLRTTQIRTFDGTEVHMPNKIMFTSPLKNYSSSGQRRLDISVGVSYSDDLENVERVVRDVAEKLDGRLKSKPVEVFFSEFGSSSINFDLRIWVDYPGQQNYLQTRHEAIIGIKKAFDKEGISIPFPIRTLDVNENKFNSLIGSLKNEN